MLYRIAITLRQCRVSDRNRWSKPWPGTHLKRLHKSQDLEFCTEKDFGIFTVCESIIDDPDHSLAHVVPQILDVLLGAKVVCSAQNVRLYEEEADNLL